MQRRAGAASKRVGRCGSSGLRRAERSAGSEAHGAQNHNALVPCSCYSASPCRPHLLNPEIAILHVVARRAGPHQDGRAAAAPAAAQPPRLQPAAEWKAGVPQEQCTLWLGFGGCGRSGSWGGGDAVAVQHPHPHHHKHTHARTPPTWEQAPAGMPEWTAPSSYHIAIQKGCCSHRRRAAWCGGCWARDSPHTSTKAEVNERCLAGGMRCLQAVIGLQRSTQQPGRQTPQNLKAAGYTLRWVRRLLLIAVAASFDWRPLPLGCYGATCQMAAPGVLALYRTIGSGAFFYLDVKM